MIVGVVENVRHQDLTTEPGFDVYAPYAQTNVSGVYFVVRTRIDPHAVASALPAIVWAIDPDQSFFDIRTFDERIATILRHQRAAGWLFGVFAALALLLAASGLYAVLANAVAQRTRELAVRLALGASGADIVGMVISQTLGLVAAGLTAGLAAAGFVARLLRTLLFGTSAFDPWTFAATPLLLTLVAVLAAYLPVRQALRVDPLIALRSE